MQKLFLIRHGESASAIAGKTDFDRELTGPGAMQITALSLKIRNLFEYGTIFISSTAERTKQTTHLLNSNSGFNVCFESILYQGTSDDYLHLLEEYAHVKTLVLVGHNPAISQLAFMLTGNALNFLPGTCAIISFGNFENDKFLKGKIEQIIRPDDLRL